MHALTVYHRAVHHRAALALLASMCFTSATSAAIVGWRTDGTGRYPDANPPIHWTETENVAWKTPLPDGTHSAPVISGDLVFVTADPAHLFCISATDGKVLWQREHGYSDVFPPEKVAEIEAMQQKIDDLQKERGDLRRKVSDLNKEGGNEAEVEKLETELKALEVKIKELDQYPKIDKRGPNGNSTSTPIVDGSRVYAVFGAGLVAAYDLEGTRLWIRYLHKPQSNWGHAASPALADGKLLVHIDQMVALDPSTGETLWESDLPARWGSLLTVNIAGEELVLTPSGALIRPQDGKQLSGTSFHLSHNSPIVADKMIFACQPGEYKAFKLPETLSGDADQKLEEVWESRGMKTRTFASPLYHEGLLYVVTEDGILVVTDAESGKTLHRERLDIDSGRVFPSPAMAGGLIYVGSTKGVTYVLKPGEKPEILARNEGEGYSGQPVFEGNRMYVRSDKHLICIVKPAGEGE